MEAPDHFSAQLQLARLAWDGSMTCGFSRRWGKTMDNSAANDARGDRVPDVSMMALTCM